MKFGFHISDSIPSTNLRLHLCPAWVMRPWQPHLRSWKDSTALKESFWILLAGAPANWKKSLVPHTTTQGFWAKIAEGANLKYMHSILVNRKQHTARLPSRSSIQTCWGRTLSLHKSNSTIPTPTVPFWLFAHFLEIHARHETGPTYTRLTALVRQPGFISSFLWIQEESMPGETRAVAYLANNLDLRIPIRSPRILQPTAASSWE